MFNWLTGRRNGAATQSYSVRFQAAKSDFVEPGGNDLYAQASAYHRKNPPGKTEITTTKPLATQTDLAIAYSPGVAGPCLEIQSDEAAAYDLTNKGNMVAVISNGTAVLGLGNIGPAAAKPVMEGKAALFKTFAGINAIDLSIAETDPERLAQTIASLQSNFAGVNLEDIKAPECFEVEARCKELMSIPVFHDDQHGTATVILAGLLNALEQTERQLSDIKLVVSGAGAAAIATLDLLSELGLSKEQVWLYDSRGLITSKSKHAEPRRARYARKSGKAVSMERALEGADVFIGVSQGGILDPEWVETMAKCPIVFALANPDPEVWPPHVHAVVPDAIVATGRSDFPNQVNNVLCFPFLFRGALDARATEISVGMLKAAAHAIAELAKTPPDAETQAAYPGEDFTYGRNMILPKPFDTRLRLAVSKAVADAARAEGLSTVTAAENTDWMREAVTPAPRGPAPTVLGAS